MSWTSMSRSFFMVAIPRTVIISRGGFSELCTGWNKVKTRERRMYRLFFINILIYRYLQIEM
mgnify:FL=1